MAYPSCGYATKNLLPLHYVLSGDSKLYMLCEISFYIPAELISSQARLLCVKFMTISEKNQFFSSSLVVVKLLKEIYITVKSSANGEFPLCNIGELQANINSDNESEKIFS